PRDEDLLVDLAPIVLREIVDELHDAWILVTCKRRPDVLLELVRELGGAREARSHDDVGLGLGEPLLFDTDDGSGGDGGMTEEALLALQRSDPLPADLEEIVRTAGEIEVALLVDAEEIACPAPMAVEGAPALVAVEPVAEAHAVPLDPEN